MMCIVSEVFLLLACGVGLTVGSVLFVLGLVGLWTGGDNAR